MALVMRRGGNIVEFGRRVGTLPNGRPLTAPLPKDVEDRFKSELTYDHLHQLRGVDAYDSFGSYRPTRTERKELFLIGDDGHFNASVGWQARLLRISRQMGHAVEVVDLDPPHPRPNRFDADWDRLFDVMDLRVKQDEILAAMETADRGILDLPPAVGKTFLIAAYCLAHPNARVHVVTDGIDVLNRIHDHLVKYISNVGRVGGGRRKFGTRVTVISADSLHVVGEGFDDPRAASSPDVVIFDEVHKAAATTILDQVRKYQRCRVYGLSGSVNMRHDKADHQLEGIFGEVVYSMTYQEAEELKLVAPVRVEWVMMDFEAPHLTNLDGHMLEKEGVWRNDERNRRFADRMNQFGPDVQCLVMVSKFEHAVQMKQFLPDYKLCYADAKDHARYVRSGLLDPADEPVMTPHRREQMRQQFEAGTLKKVISTDVWSTGVDFAALSVLCRADARGSAIMDTQIPCRANRVHRGKEYALVIDGMDLFNDKLLGRSNSRKRNYVKKGWSIEGLSTKRIGVLAARMNRR